MLAVARDEHALALQAATEEPPENGERVPVEAVEEARPAARRPRRQAETPEKD